MAPHHPEVPEFRSEPQYNSYPNAFSRQFYDVEMAEQRQQQMHRLSQNYTTQTQLQSNYYPQMGPDPQAHGYSQPSYGYQPYFGDYNYMVAPPNFQQEVGWYHNGSYYNESQYTPTSTVTYPAWEQNEQQYLRPPIDYPQHHYQVPHNTPTGSELGQNNRDTLDSHFDYLIERLRTSAAHPRSKSSVHSDAATLTASTISMDDSPTLSQTPQDLNFLEKNSRRRSRSDNIYPSSIASNNDTTTTFNNGNRTRRHTLTEQPDHITKLIDQLHRSSIEKQQIQIQAEEENQDEEHNKTEGKDLTNQRNPLYNQVLTKITNDFPTQHAQIVALQKEITFDNVLHDWYYPYPSKPALNPKPLQTNGQIFLATTSHEEGLVVLMNIIKRFEYCCRKARRSKEKRRIRKEGRRREKEREKERERTKGELVEIWRRGLECGTLRQFVPRWLVNSEDGIGEQLGMNEVEEVASPTTPSYLEMTSSSKSSPELPSTPELTSSLEVTTPTETVPTTPLPTLWSDILKKGL